MHGEPTFLDFWFGSLTIFIIIMYDLYIVLILNPPQAHLKFIICFDNLAALNSSQWPLSGFSINFFMATQYDLWAEIKKSKIYPCQYYLQTCESLSGWCKYVLISFFPDQYLLWSRYCVLYRKSTTLSTSLLLTPSIIFGLFVSNNWRY